MLQSFFRSTARIVSTRINASLLRSTASVPSAAMKTVRIDVVSDTVCPWCFVGKRRMESALKKFDDKLQFDIYWHPFQLDSDASLEGINKMQLYNDKFGADRVAAMIPAMKENFLNEGLPEPSYGGLTGNTFNSHRLIWWARTKGADVQNALVEELMLNYFCQEKFINDRAVLLAAAEKAGLQGAGEFLDSDEGKAEVKHELVEFARANRITGVPFYIVDGKQTLSGAQPGESWESILKSL